MAPERQSVVALLSSEQGLQWRKVHHGQARLESSRRSSIVLAAFAFAVFSSLQLNFPSSCPDWLMTLLATNSALLVAMHSFAFVISTWLLPSLQAVAREYTPPQEGDHVLGAVPAFSPHDRFHGFVELSYNISHVLGLFLFLVEIVIIAWVKFWDISHIASIVSTAIMIPFMIAFAAFCWYFHRTLRKQIYNSRADLLQHVEEQYRTDKSLVSAFSPSDIKKRDAVSEELEENYTSDETLVFHLSPSPVRVRSGLPQELKEQNMSDDKLLYNFTPSPIRKRLFLPQEIEKNCQSDDALVSNSAAKSPIKASLVLPEDVKREQNRPDEPRGCTPKPTKRTFPLGLLNSNTNSDAYAGLLHSNTNSNADAGLLDSNTNSNANAGLLHSNTNSNADAGLLDSNTNSNANAGLLHSNTSCETPPKSSHSHSSSDSSLVWTEAAADTPSPKSELDEMYHSLPRAAKRHGNTHEAALSSEKMS